MLIKEMERLQDADVDIETLVRCYSRWDEISGYIKIVKENEDRYSMNDVIKVGRFCMVMQNGHQLIASSVNLIRKISVNR